MIGHFFTKQFLGFLVVGGLAAFLHWVSRIILSNWLSFSWAVLAAYLVGMAVAFILNTFFVFPNSDKPRYRQARDFVLVNVSFLPVVWAASLAIDHWFRELGIIHYTQALAHGIAVAIPTLATFLIYKYFAFKDIGYERT